MWSFARSFYSLTQDIYVLPLYPRVCIRDTCTASKYGWYVPFLKVCMICNLRNEGREVEKIVHIFIFSIVSFCVLLDQPTPRTGASSNSCLVNWWTSSELVSRDQPGVYNVPKKYPSPPGRRGLLINNFVPATNFSGNDYPQLIYWIPMTGNPDSLEGIIIIIRRRDILLLELAQRSSSNSSPKIIPKYT